MDLQNAEPKRTQFKKGERLEVIIESVSFGSDSIGRFENMVVFVAEAVPGDVVEVEIIKVKKTFLIGKLIKVIKPALLRNKPRCPHFGFFEKKIDNYERGCGGCSWQHIDYAEQLKIKQKLVSDSLERLGGIKADTAPIIGMDNPWFYRNKLEYTFGEFEGRCELGFHKRQSFWQIIPIQQCFLESLESNKIIDSIRKFAQESNLPVYNPRTHLGLWRHVLVREGKNTGEKLVHISVGEIPKINFEDFAHRLMGDFASIKSFSVGINNSPSDALKITIPYFLNGVDHIFETILKKRFKIGLSTFFQTNTEMLQKISEYVINTIEPESALLDLYCGVGTFSILAADRINTGYGIEISEQSIVHARENAKLNGMNNLSFISRDVEKAELPEHDILLVDPPRSGLSPKALQKILELQNKKMIYVSCNPTTLARDLKELVKKYDIVEIQPFDNFPQTYHVETMVVLKKS